VNKWAIRQPKKMFPQTNQDRQGGEGTVGQKNLMTIKILKEKGVLSGPVGHKKGKNSKTARFPTVTHCRGRGERGGR